MSFDNIKQALKRADHFAPEYRTNNLTTRLRLQRRRHIDTVLPKKLAKLGIPNAKLLWDASDDYTSKLVTIDDIARGLNRFVDNNRAAGNPDLTYVMRWWRSLLFFNPRII